MPTIKRKVEMNLPQLIEWAMENNIKDTVFLTKAYSIGFDIHGFIYFNSSTTIPLDTVFTVEVEEEITEDMELDLIERFIGGTGSVCYTSHTMTIKECLKRTPKACKTTHIYIENDERELVLIWQDGKLEDK